MKAKLIIEDKEIEVEISEEEYKKIQLSEEKKTGDERVAESDIYFYANSRGYVETDSENCYSIDGDHYKSANYYSDKTVAKNNARADKLMRQLRRFSVEHREDGVNLNDVNTRQYCIYYDYGNNTLGTAFTLCAKTFGVICFDSDETALAAINEFRDELIWYFTEYKDSL